MAMGETQDRFSLARLRVFASGFNNANMRLLFAIFLNSIPVGFMLVYFSIYLNNIVNEPFLVGAAFAISTVANTVFLIPFSTRADRYGRKKFVICGFALPALTFLVLAFTTNSIFILIFSAIGAVGLSGGLAQAINGPAWTAFVSDTSDDSNRAKVFGAAQAFWTLALTIGSILAAFPSYLSASYTLDSRTASSLTFIIMAMISIISAIPVISIPDRFKFAGDSGEGVVTTTPALFGIGSRIRRLVTKGTFNVPISSKKAIGKLSVAFFLTGFGLGISIQFLSLWFNLKFGVSEATIAPWFALAEFVSLPVIVIIPLLTKRLGSVRSVLLTQSLSSLFLLLIAFSKDYVSGSELYVVRNFLMNISWPIQQSYMMGIVLRSERASTAGITSAIWGIAATAGSILGGYLLQLPDRGFGLFLPIFLGFASYASSAIFFFFSFRRTREGSNDNNDTIAK
jgi:MFS family permease